MAKFETGNPGRPKGAKNKTSGQIRDKIQTLFDSNFETIQEDLESLDPRDRLKFLTDLLPYLVPKLQNTTHRQTIDLDSMDEEDLDILIDRIVNDGKREFQD